MSKPPICWFPAPVIHPVLGGERSRLKLAIERPEEPLAAAGKGAWQGLCNRTACQKPPAQWWNPHTRAYYCESCARMLNDVFERDHIALCTERSPCYGDSNIVCDSPPGQCKDWCEYNGVPAPKGENHG